MRTYKYIALAAISLLFAACEKDDITPSAQNDTDAVRINASIGHVNTRIALDGENVSFAEGDKILVENQSRTSNNKAIYTLTSGEWETSSPLYWTNGVNNFRAVYPYNASFDEFIIPMNQMDLSGADWMIATNTLNKPDSGYVLDLRFQHQLSMVTVEIANVGTELKSPAYTLDIAVFFPNSETAENSHIQFEGPYVYPSMTYPNSPVYDKLSMMKAILRPGKYPADSKFMQISIAEKTFDVKANDLLVTEGLKPGFDYKFKINIGKDLVEVVDVDVTPWIEVAPFEGIAVSAAVADKANATGFENGQTMTVAAVAGGTTTSVNYIYNQTMQEWRTTEALMVNDLTEITSVNAWIGYPGISKTSYAITSNDFLTDVPNKICDQTTGLMPFDWMVPSSVIALPAKSNPKIDVEFIHAMSKVTINSISYASEFETKPVLEELAFVSRPCLSYDPATGNFTTGSQNGVDYAKVLPYVLGAYSYSALVVPNSSEGVTETTLLTLKVNGVEQVVKINGAIEPGKHYTFNLKIASKYAQLEPVETDLGWNDEVEL